MESRKLPRILLGLAVFVLVGLSPVTVHAVDSSSEKGIGISPSLVELNATRGNVYEVTLKITNVTPTDLVYESSTNDFTSADESGSPHVVLNSTTPSSASIIKWVAPIPKFTLKSHQEKVITAQIIVPANAEPGGHYGVIRFSGQPPELKTSGVGLSFSAGLLLLIRVDGNIAEKASLVSLFSAAGANESWFFESSPINLVTRIQNQGNVHVKPTGSIEVRDMFGNLVATLPVNADKNNILPDSIRRFESKLDGIWMMGRYTATVMLGYGTNGQVISGTTSFWVVPYRLILAILAVIGLIVFILNRIAKVYNKRVVERVKREIELANKQQQEERAIHELTPEIKAVETKPIEVKKDHKKIKIQ